MRAGIPSHAPRGVASRGNPLAWDRYAYAHNNPILYNDPSGHCVGPLAIVCVFLIENATPLIVAAVGAYFFVENASASVQYALEGDSQNAGIYAAQALLALPSAGFAGFDVYNGAKKWAPTNLLDMSTMYPDSKIATLGLYNNGKGYTLNGDKLKATHLDIPQDIYIKLSPSSRLSINKEFLDLKIIEPQKPVFIQPDVRTTQQNFPTSTYMWELDYMLSHGYVEKIINNLHWLFPRLPGE